MEREHPEINSIFAGFTWKRKTEVQQLEEEWMQRKMCT